jgi:hypothetical protein
MMKIDIRKDNLMNHKFYFNKIDKTIERISLNWKENNYASIQIKEKYH